LFGTRYIVAHRSDILGRFGQLGRNEDVLSCP
jgi:hypothetical protein